MKRLAAALVLLGLVPGRTLSSHLKVLGRHQRGWMQSDGPRSPHLFDVAGLPGLGERCLRRRVEPENRKIALARDGL